MLSDVRPAVHEEIRVGLQFRELDARVGLEGVPKVVAAIAHRLHLALVFLVARDEFAPIVLQAELLGQQVVRMRAVVRQLRPLCDFDSYARLRIRWETMQVRVLLPAPEIMASGSPKKDRRRLFLYLDQDISIWIHTMRNTLGCSRLTFVIE